jgi:hypothetical protein
MQARVQVLGFIFGPASGPGQGLRRSDPCQDREFCPLPHQRLGQPDRNGRQSDHLEPE